MRSPRSLVSCWSRIVSSDRGPGRRHCQAPRLEGPAVEVSGPGQADRPCQWEDRDPCARPLATADIPDLALPNLRVPVWIASVATRSAHGLFSLMTSHVHANLAAGPPLVVIKASRVPPTSGRSCVSSRPLSVNAVVGSA